MTGIKSLTNWISRQYYNRIKNKICKWIWWQIIISIKSVRIPINKWWWLLQTSASKTSQMQWIQCSKLFINITTIIWLVLIVLINYKINSCFSIIMVIMRHLMCLSSNNFGISKINICKWIRERGIRRRIRLCLSNHNMWQTTLWIGSSRHQLIWEVVNWK